jgi:hypothetical protein
MPWTNPETFTAGQTLTAASMNVISGGLQKEPGAVHLGTYTASAGSSLDAQSAFSADYTNYYVIASVTALSAPTTAAVYMRMMNGASAATGSVYMYMTWTFANDSSSGAGGGLTTYWPFMNASGSGFARGNATITIVEPYATAYTQVRSSSTRINSVGGGGSMRELLSSGGINATTSYDGCQLYASTGTITGTLDVYGIAPKA